MCAWEKGQVTWWQLWAELSEELLTDCLLQWLSPAFVTWLSHVTSSRPGIALHWECGVLATGLPGSPYSLLFRKMLGVQKMLTTTMWDEGNPCGVGETGWETGPPGH